MNTNEIDSLVNKLETIQQYYGVGGVIFIVILSIIIILLYRFIITRIEKVAEEITEKNLKKFQSEIDKGLVKFSTKHQKQIDAVQECYQKFQQLKSMVDFTIKGEKFTAQMHPNEEVNCLTTYRLEFKRSYNKNKILFPESLNAKIEELFPAIDKFLEDFIGGLLPSTPEEFIPEEEKGQPQIAGVWAIGKLEPTLEKMEEISKEIENEFRKIYGNE